MKTKQGRTVKKKLGFFFFDGNPMSYINHISGVTGPMLGESKTIVKIIMEELDDDISMLTVQSNIEWLTTRLESLEATIRRHNQLGRDIPKNIVMELLELSKFLL